MTTHKKKAKYHADSQRWGGGECGGCRRNGGYGRFALFSSPFHHPSSPRSSERTAEEKRKRERERKLISLVDRKDG